MTMIPDDEIRPPPLRFVARLLVRTGSAVVMAICFVGAVLYLFRRAWPRLWH
jgi:hypothetical protein